MVMKRYGTNSTREAPSHEGLLSFQGHPHREGNWSGTLDWAAGIFYGGITPRMGPWKFIFRISESDAYTTSTLVTNLASQQSVVCGVYYSSENGIREVTDIHDYRKGVKS